MTVERNTGRASGTRFFNFDEAPGRLLPYTDGRQMRGREPRKSGILESPSIPFLLRAFQLFDRGIQLLFTIERISQRGAGF